MVKKQTKISVNQLEKQSLAQLAPVVLVLGQEQVLLKRVQTYLAQLLSPDEQKLNFSRYDLTETSLATVLDDAASMPFFGEWRLIIVKSPYFLTAETIKTKVKQPVDRLGDYLKNPQPSTKLIIWADYDKLDHRKKITKQLLKQALIVDTGKVAETAIERYLQRDCQQLRVEIEPQALRLLIQRVRADYTAAYQQLQQLALYVGSGQKITTAVVSQNVAQVIDDNVFDLVTATLNHQLSNALLIYQKLLENGSEPIALLALILAQVRLLLQTKIYQQQGLAQGRIAQELKVHPYRIKLALQQDRQFKLRQLKQMFTELVLLDLAIKSGQVDKNSALELLITKFASRKTTP